MLSEISGLGSRPTARTTRSKSRSTVLEMLIRVAQPDIPRARNLEDAGGHALDVLDILLASGPFVVLVEVLPEGPDIHVEDRGLQARGVFAGHQGLFGRGHAADGGAVVIAGFGVPGADALYPGDSLRFLAVIPADDVSGEGAGGREHPLELDARQDVPVPVEPVFPFALGVKFFEARRQDDGADIQGDGLFRHGVVDGLLVAGGDALHAFGTEGAVQAALGLRHGLLLGKSGFDLPEIVRPLARRKHRRLGPLFLFHVVRGGQELLRQGLQRVGKTVRPEVLPVEVAFDRFGGPFCPRPRPG